MNNYIGRIATVLAMAGTFGCSGPIVINYPIEHDTYPYPGFTDSYSDKREQGKKTNYFVGDSGMLDGVCTFRYTGPNMDGVPDGSCVAVYDAENKEGLIGFFERSIPLEWNATPIKRMN